MTDLSEQDALLLLKKWRESGSVLRIISPSAAGTLNAIGVLGGKDERLVLGDGSNWRFDTLIDGATFRLSGPEEAPASVKAASLDKYECLLEVTFPTGESFALLEIKGPPQ
jgi:hypothetical protein